LKPSRSIQFPSRLLSIREAQSPTATDLCHLSQAVVYPLAETLVAPSSRCHRIALFGSEPS
ncbi:hypothetical protein Csa_015416, partial [Cucumis sativus]